MFVGCDHHVDRSLDFLAQHGLRFQRNEALWQSKSVRVHRLLRLCARSASSCAQFSFTPSDERGFAAAAMFSPIGSADVVTTATLAKTANTTTITLAILAMHGFPLMLTLASALRAYIARVHGESQPVQQVVIIHSYEFEL